jgi:hypothetical protein
MGSGFGYFLGLCQGRFKMYKSSFLHYKYCYFYRVQDYSIVAPFFLLFLLFLLFSHEFSTMQSNYTSSSSCSGYGSGVGGYSNPGFIAPVSSLSFAPQQGNFTNISRASPVEFSFFLDNTVTPGARLLNEMTEIERRSGDQIQQGVQYIQQTINKQASDLGKKNGEISAMLESKDRTIEILQTEVYRLQANQIQAAPMPLIPSLPPAHVMNAAAPAVHSSIPAFQPFSNDGYVQDEAEVLSPTNN